VDRLGLGLGLKNRVSVGLQIIPHTVGRLGFGLWSGPHVVDRLESGMWISASFQIIPWGMGRLGLGSGPKSGRGVISEGYFW